MVSIKNNNLINYIQTILNKKIDNVELNDLDTIKKVYFEGELKQEDSYKIDISDLSQFKNIEQISIKNALITLENLELIVNSGTKKVSLIGCALDNDFSLSVLKNINSLELNSCFIEDYKFIEELTSLESLVIFRCQNKKEINASLIPTSIKYLTLQECFIDNFNSISKLNNLEILNILRSKINGDIVPTLNQLPKLNTLYITNLYNLKGLNDNIQVYNDFMNLLFDKEESEKHI